MELMKEFYTIREAADLLGVHYQSIRAWIKEGKLRAVKVKRTVRISKEALQDLIKEG